MVSLSGDQSESKDTNASDRLSEARRSVELSAQIDTDQMFQLVESILPFEACLYHQVLPMSVEGSRLNLGMVNPEDTTALDYVRRLVAYINCSLVPRKISSDVHQTMLSAYLSYADKKKQALDQKKQAMEKARAAARPKPAPIDRNDQATLIVDSPDEIDTSDTPIARADIPRKAQTVEPAIAKSVPSAAPTRTDSEPEASSEELPTFVLKSEMAAAKKTQPAAPSAPALPRLEVMANHLDSPIEVLSVLPPKNLLHELLARVLAGGIGRLFFERQQANGRILWSQDGVLQSVLDGIDPAIFQGVINELKRLTELPQLTVQKPRQVEIERLYQDTRLVLRFRVMPGKHGEEATLQVLRGAALRFHQQQQLTNLGRDALGMAQQLQRKLSELSSQAQAEPLPQGAQLDSLDALRQMLKSMNQQLQALESLKAESEGGSASLPGDSPER